MRRKREWESSDSHNSDGTTGPTRECGKNWVRENRKGEKGADIYILSIAAGFSLHNRWYVALIMFYPTDFNAGTKSRCNKLFYRGKFIRGTWFCLKSWFLFPRSKIVKVAKYLPPLNNLKKELVGKSRFSYIVNCISIMICRYYTTVPTNYQSDILIS